MSINIFVLGLDELNLETLRHTSHDEYVFHTLLHKDRLVGTEEIDLAGLLDEAQQQLESFDGSIDAIVGYWDFPVSSMVPILCKRYGLPSASLESVVKCEHKYWSRLEQRKVIDDVPGFAIIALDNREGLPDTLDYPVWLKPVKSASSELAFRVDNREDFDAALEEIRAGIDKFGDPFEYVMEQLDLPPEIADVGAAACLAEEAVGGLQITVEGYSVGGETHIYGIIDSLTYPDSSSFLRYQIPTRLPEGVRDRLVDSSRKVIEQVGLESTPFNIEYFWDSETDRIRLLEVNPRHSQSHAVMFEDVHGVSNHDIMVELALGHTPPELKGDGSYKVAAKWFLRAFEDGLVTRCPAPEDVERITAEIPGVVIHIVADKGGRLSDLPQQDSYSFELAQVFVGAQDEAELIEKYDRCVDLLDFRIER